MATHCLIARENRDGSFDAITVHFGHPDRAWAMVRMPEETEESVQAIVEELLKGLEHEPAAPLGLDQHEEAA
jgi:hypothetical protein